MSQPNMYNDPNPQEYRPTPVFRRIPDNQIHWKRRTEIIKKHPEVKLLYGKDNMSAVWSIIVVSMVYGLAYLVYLISKTKHAIDNPNLFIFEIFLLAYCIGACLDHALWVLIHEFGHDLGFESDALNSLFLCISNLPHLLPSASSFKFYHKLHHISLNETYADPDIPSPSEAKFFGNTIIGKMLWIFLFSVMQLVRASRGPFMKFTLELVLNYVLNITVNVIFVYNFGLYTLLFLLISGFFAIGLHPMGARWIAEHYAVHPDQETYSYYGFINKIAFNIGYHNEHHDFPQAIPQSRLPLLSEQAKEFYEPLYKHDSYLMVLWNFFTDSHFTLQSRVVRNDRKTQETDGDKLIAPQSAEVKTE